MCVITLFDKIKLRTGLLKSPTDEGMPPEFRGRLTIQNLSKKKPI